MALIDVSPLVAGFNVGPLTLQRAAAGALNEYGGRDTGSVASLTLDPVAVHTVSGLDLAQLPEANRTTETIRVYARVPLAVGTDTLVYRSASYRIVVVDDQNLQGGVYTALAQREEVAPS